MAKQIFSQTVDKTSFGLTADVSTFAGKFQEIAELRVPAQQKNFFGNGAIVNGVQNSGILYINLKDTADAAIPGLVRLVVKDGNKLSSRVIIEERASRLSASNVDRQTAYFLGLRQPGAKEDSYLVIELKPDADVTVDVDNTTFEIPITIETD